MATFVSRKSLSSATLIDEIPARIRSVVKWSVAPIAALSALAQRFNLYAGIGAHLRVLPNGIFCPTCSNAASISLEQCKATSSGRGGDCRRDLFLPPANTLAYAPKAVGAKHHTKVQAGHHQSVDLILWVSPGPRDARGESNGASRRS